MPSLWNFGIIHNPYKETTKFTFMGGAPYYQDSYRNFLNNTAIRIFFKYNNDNNPYPIVTLTPLTVFGGLSSIGGAIKMFALLKIVLYLYNK